MIQADFTAAFRRKFPEVLGRPVLVALSGGADSVALLCLLHGARGELGSAVHACHVHHHVRGSPADEDAAYCGELCNRLGVPFAVEHLDPARPRGSSPEAWWRRERYRALEAARRRMACLALVTAHTRDDQAETVLLKLLRGAGPRGVAGVRLRSGAVIRPLLDFRRGDLRAWLTERGIAWREDASNTEETRPRAWIRGRLIPLVAQGFPNAVTHLAAFAAALAQDDDLITVVLRERAAWPAVGETLRIESVAALPPPLLRRWVLELASRLPLVEPPSRSQLEAVELMVANGTPAAVDLGRHWVLRRRRGALALCPPRILPFPPQAARVPSRLELPGGFVASLGAVESTRARHRVVLSRRLADAPLAWRSVVPGERFGGETGKPVTRALTRAGVPAEWRRAWPALEAGGTMVWLPAVGVAEGWAGSEADGVVAGLEEPWERRAR